MKFSDPEENVDQLDLQPHSVVADFGAGTGMYSFACAKKVKDSKVYAVDVHKDILTRLSEEARNKNIFNIETIWGDLEKIGGSRIKENAIDVVIIANTLFQVSDKKIFLSGAKRVLKIGGRLVIIDWSDSFGGMGPSKDMVLTKEEVISLTNGIGFSFQREISVGSHHYGLILNKK